MAPEKTAPKNDEKAVEAKPAPAVETTVEAPAPAPVEAATPAPAVPQTPPPPPVVKDEPPVAPVQAPAKNGLVKVRVLRNLFHDGRRFRAKGELTALTAAQLRTAGSAVERA